MEFLPLVLHAAVTAATGRASLGHFKNAELFSFLLAVAGGSLLPVACPQRAEGDEAGDDIGCGRC